MTKNTTKIGIIGTGIIGLPVANNLLKKKYNVYAYVRNKKKHSEISKKGIIIKRSLAEFFRSIDILILAVSDTNDVKNILIGKNGLNKSLKTPSIVIDMSTICPIETIKISNELSKNFWINAIFRKKYFIFIIKYIFFT